MTAPKLSYDFADVEPPDPATAVPNRPDELGYQVGSIIADWAEKGAVLDAKAHPNAPDPCATCAFTRGTMPNGCLPTVANALKCVVEVEHLFYCHHGLKPGDENPTKLCAGYMHALTYTQTPEGAEKVALFAAISEFVAEGGKAK